MDATNSGGQHFSGLLRDPVGGTLTNLVWKGNDQKADLYMDVKQRTDSKVIMDLADPDYVVQATYWRENEITRTMTKRPSMTYFYSATIRSCAEYIIQGAKDEGYESTEEYSMWALAGYLAPRMRAAIDEANPAAAVAMRYLQALCRRVPMEKDLRWKTPLGGLVVNRYTESEECTVKVMSMNLTMLLAYNRNYDRCNRRKATAGIAPNFVHSLDSTHLMMVVNNANCDILPIHDSLATHACDVDEMHRVIREQFVKLYTENDPLEVVREAAEAAGADVEDIERPTLGTLDLQSVLNSPFFFC
jgi:DNA-directed RNA polymerase